MSTKRGKAVFGIGLVLFGLAVFMVASAYLVFRDYPKWLAAAVGGLAFPVLPVVWHVVGERRRRLRLAEAKTPPKSTLAAGDRYLMRAFAVAVLVLAPMFAIGRLTVLRAAWDYKLWFLPDNFDSIGNSDEMFAHLPSDADAVLVIREHDDNSGKFGVIAYGDRQLAMIVPEKFDDKAQDVDKLKELNQQRGKVPFIKIEELTTVALGKDLLGIATDRWKDTIRVEGTGPRTAIKDELAKAPSDALISLAYVPVKPVDGIQKLSGWVLQKGVNEKLTVEGRIDAVDAASAVRVLDTVRALWKIQRSELPESCRDEITKLTDKAEIETKGATITFHLAIEPDQLMGLMMCGMKGAKLDDN